MPETRRKHVSTGRPRGGTRVGAGRPKDSQNVLGYGDVKAMGAANLRLPADASPGAAQLGAESLQRLYDVMLERCPAFQAGHVLKAATRLREEVCGPLAQKVQHTGANGESLVVEIHKLSAKAEEDADAEHIAEAAQPDGNGGP